MERNEERERLLRLAESEERNAEEAIRRERREQFWRFEELVRATGALSRGAFLREVGAKGAALAAARSFFHGNGDIPASLLRLIYRRYPDTDLGWLLTGVPGTFPGARNR